MSDSICLIAHTKSLLANRPRSLTLAQLARDCDVSIHWLNAFSAGAYADPSATRVQRLYERLSGNTLIKIAE